MHVSFKTKIETLTDNGVKREFFRVPVFTAHHASMNWFRTSKLWGSYANSDLFPAMLQRIRARFFPRPDLVFLDSVDPHVSINSSGFLAVVSIDLNHLTERP